VKHILDRLKDDEEYYNGIGKQYLSNSVIYSLLNNPKGFNKGSGDSKNLLEGSYFHQLILEPEKAKNTKIIDASSRNTNIYKDAVAENNGKMALLRSESNEIESLVKLMKSNVAFYDLIYASGNQFEVPAIGNIKGFEWKGKADIVGEDMLIDLKTTSDIGKFRWSAKDYNYDSQCYLYQMLFGKPLLFLVVCKKSGKLGMYRPSEEFVGNGEEKVEKALEVYQKFFGDNPTEDIDNYFINETL
jgi:hypothetical protein